MVTVMVTSHKIIKKNIEGSRKITLYNIYKTHINLKKNTWSFRLGQRSSSMDHSSLVCKIDNLIQSSPLSSFVLTLI